ncbi:MAG TPA: GAF domain-containing sensor histidine kinase [Candidatus Limnocylindrales bacterium]|nr:GAF domain-containing sensor histidine kinase [Candidatus Limnocylindrales bacterium]
MTVSLTADADLRQLLGLLEELLDSDVRDLDHALDEATTRIAKAFEAEKVDAFLIEHKGEVLRARGTSRTKLGDIQKAMGLDVLAISNGGRTAEVFLTGDDHLDGRVEQDPDELEGIKQMGVRSTLATAIVVGDERRGVLQLASPRADAFDEHDQSFLRAVARWVGILAHRAELLEHRTKAALEEGRRLAAEELVTVLAHDLGNYLTPLRGRLELCIRDARKEGRNDDEERLAAGIANVDAVMTLTNDLLDVSRIEGGILRIRPSQFELKPMVEKMAPALATEDVTVDVQIPAGLCVTADQWRLGQVLTNLIGNAVKHAPRTSSVRVSADQPDGQVVIKVEDEGPGVPTDIMPRVFMRYARGPRSTGLGIGLYLAERIATAHGGSLTLDSSQSGATFTLRLPKSDGSSVTV